MEGSYLGSHAVYIPATHHHIYSIHHDDGDDGDDHVGDGGEEEDDDYENVYFIVNIFNQNVVKRVNLCLRRIVCASR